MLSEADKTGMAASFGHTSYPGKNVLCDWLPVVDLPV